MQEVLLGIDSGTTRTKAAAFTLDGELIRVESRENPQMKGDGQRAEQDPEQVWETTTAVTKAITDDVDASITAVGVTGQAHGCWLLGSDGAPVRDAVLWLDSRADSTISTWRDDGTMEALVDVCGSEPFSGTGFAILSWLADHEPETVARAESMVSCKDWLKYKLTGTVTTDRTEVSVPFVSRETRAVTDEPFELAGIGEHRSLLPNVVAPETVVGSVTDEAAAATGIPAGTPIVGGATDTTATAFGTGVSRPEEASAVLGTAIIAAGLSETPASPETVSLDAGSRYVNVIGSRGGTRSIDWLRREFDADYETLETAASEVPVGAGGVRYLPFLSTTGEDGPFVDPNARAGFLGMSPEHSTEHLVRAVYEAIALVVRDCLTTLPESSGPIHLGGGGSRSKFWSQLIADCLGETVVVSEGDEYGAKGVALLAGVGTDVYPDVSTAIDRTTTVDRRHVPDPARADRYDVLYDQYTSLVEEMSSVWALNRRLESE